MTKEIPQWTEAQLAAATPAQIVTAQNEGRLATLLGSPNAPLDASGDLDADDIKRLHAEGRYEAIEQARREGRILA